MSSPRVRRIVGFLFSKKIQKSSLDEMLMIEAPELRLQSFEGKLMNVSYYLASNSLLLLNAQWTIQVQTAQGDTTLMKEAELKDSTEQSAQQICALAAQPQAVVSLKLTADQLKLNLRNNSKNEAEDYNFINTFEQDTDVMTLLLDNTSVTANCVGEINKNKRAILKQILK